MTQIKHVVLGHDRRFRNVSYNRFVLQARRSETRAKWLVSLSAAALVGLLFAM